MITVYVSIPITGLDEQKQREKASTIESELKSRGYKTINPFTISDNIHCDNLSYKDYLWSDINNIFNHSDAIFMCNGWHESRGCLAEFHVAKAIGLEIIFE